MQLILADTNDISLAFIELGAIIIGLAILAWLANQLSLPAIPLYLIAGLAFGKGGIFPIRFSENFVHLGAEIGVILLLFMLGLEYTGEELGANLRSGLAAGAVDFALNFSPGLLTGFVLGWSPIAAIILGGVTYISSSGVIAKLLADLKWTNNPETPTILSILVLEDIAMAGFLPLITVLLLGGAVSRGMVSVLVAIVTVAIVLFIAIRFGKKMSALVSNQSDEIILLTIFGAVLLVAGIAQQLQVSAAVGAFLVGIALSDPIVKQTYRLLSPLRDLFAAIFFLFFGLEIDPATLPPVLWSAIALGILAALTKIATGWWAARRAGLSGLSRLRTGTILIARGEFSIVIAGLAVSAGLEPELGTLSAAFVLFSVLLTSLLVRALKPFFHRRLDEKSP